MPNNNNSSGLNEQITGQAAIVEKTLEAVKKVTVQIGKQKEQVIALNREYDEVEKEQESILNAILNQEKYQKRLNEAADDANELAKIQNDIQKDMEKVLENRAKNSLMFLSNEQRAEAFAEGARQKVRDFEEERRQLINEYTIAVQNGDTAEINLAKQRLERNKKDLEEWTNTKKKFDDEANIYASYSAEQAQRKIKSNEMKEELETLRRKKKLDEDEKKRYKQLKKDKQKIDQEFQEQQQRDNNIDNEESHSWVSKKGNVTFDFGQGRGVGTELKETLGTAISAGVKKLAQAMDNAVDSVVKQVVSYQQKINYRLETIQDKDFKSMQKTVNSIVGNTGVVKQQQVIDAIGKAVDQGIAYNIEQRAFLSTIAENIQSTFDTFDANLLRIIRIQQQDSTTARMGMEKALNDMLNSYYKDTTYLKDVYDSVSQALFEMTAGSTRESAIETEFVVQKWLGSLYSLGASSNAVQQIATGLGYLGSGNVAALSGNQGLQSLLALSASKAGLDYAELLTNGLNGSDTNRLLNAMVKYLAEIADSTAENKVVTSSYGNIFGLAISDIKSFQNLQASATEIFGETLDYKASQEYLQRSLNNYMNYMSLAQRIENVIDNVKYGVGLDYADGAAYGIYKGIQTLEELTGGGPTFKISPWGIGMSATIFDIIKSSMFGIGMLAKLIGGAETNPMNVLNLSNWGYEDIVTRGTGFGLKGAGGSSYSYGVGNASSSDATSQTIKEGTETADTVTSESGKEVDKDFGDIYDALVFNGDKGQLSLVNQTVTATDQKLQKALQILEEISTTSSRKSLNINIQKVAGRDVGTGMDIPLATAPSTDWKDLIVAAAVLIKYGTQLGGFGGQSIQTMIDNEANTDEYTLQDFLNLMIPIIESDTGVPVRLESVDSMTNLMSDLTKR